MKKIYSKFLITVLILMVTSVIVFGQKKILFIGRGLEANPAEYMSDKDLVDSLTSWGFVVTYVSNDTYKIIDASVYTGMDGIFFNETVDSKAIVNFGPIRDNYPLPCVNLEPFVTHQDRWGWLDDVTVDLIQAVEGAATEDNTIIIIKDNSHYITEIFENNQEVKWSNAVDADLTNTRTCVIKEVNVEYTGKLATVKANENDDGFWNLVTVDKSDNFPNKMVLWGINAIGLNGSDLQQHYGTQEFFTIIKRASEWAYDAMPTPSTIENRTVENYKLVAFPNPATEQVTIRFNSPKAAPAKVILYYVTGQELAVLLNKTVQVGNNFIFLDAANFNKGIYFIKLQIEEKAEFTKIVFN